MKKVLLLSLLALSFIISWSACNEPTSLGADFIEDNEFLDAVYADTFTLRIQTTQLDTFPAVSKSNYLLGALNDETFGFASAGIFSDILLGANDVSFGANPVLDSIVLTLKYDNILFGDSTVPSQIRVYELEEELSDTIGYFSNKSFAYKADPIGEVQQIFYDYIDSINLIYYTRARDGGDSLYVFKAPPHLRIRLNDEIGERFLQESQQDTLRASTFSDIFKGIYIEADAANRAMASFNMRSNISKISLFYANDSTKGNIYEFPINETATVSSFYQVEYGNSIVGNQIQSPYPNSQEYIYMQSLDGLGFKLDAPFFTTKEAQKFLLNKIELEMTMLSQDGVNYTNDTRPRRLVMSSYLTDSLLYDTENFLSNTTLDTIDASTGDIVQVKFNTATGYRNSINGYYQGLLDGRFIDGDTAINRSTLLFMNLQDFTGYRAVFGGPEHPEYPMRLKAIYTPIND